MSIRVPPDIALAKTRPGRYIVTENANLNVFFIIEVDEEGGVHQLNWKGERDGLLQDDRWVREEVIVYPLKRIKP